MTWVNLEKIHRTINSERSGFGGALVKAGLSLSSTLFGSAVNLRNLAYDWGILPTSSSPIPCTVSIGNIQVGGSGKTPFTLMLAQHFQKSFHTAILSRGYRSAISHKASLVINDSLGIRYSASFCGDEPYLLAQRMPDLPVIISQDRLKGAALAATQGIELLLLDDGFQHRRLARDFDIVLMDGSLPAESQQLLPRGLLREKPTALSRADLVVLTRSRNPSSLIEQLSHYTKAPIICADLEIAEICGWHAKVRTSLDSQKVALFCGIANPSSFIHTVKGLGVNVVTQHIFADHTSYNLSRMSQIALEAKKKGAVCLLCTEKDSVKILPWANKLELPLVWPKMEMRITSGLNSWENWLNQVTETAKRRRGCSFG